MQTSQDRLRDYYTNSNENEDEISINTTTSSSPRKKANNSMFTFPTLVDENMMMRISEKQEFYDTQEHSKNIDELEKISDEICNQDFQLAPHQTFIRNFMSRITPYNSLLLYHGLGTGKTCSAIGVAEEMRIYMKQMNIRKKILIVASPNVQENFRLQLFDERKLKQINGAWNISSCVGQSLFNEINILQTDDLEKDYIIEKINILINKYYEFIGYTKFATLIMSKKRKNVLEETFEGRLIIIDEAHNIRAGNDKTLKKVAAALNKLVEEVHNVRLLLLSATPMFDNYREIIQIINILLKNEKRDIMVESEIFDSNGNFITDEDGKEIGKTDFARKINGLVSFVQGENPFSFPFRIFPKLFSPDDSFKGTAEYPKYQLNDAIILNPIEHIDIFTLSIEGYQREIYDKIVKEKLSKPIMAEKVEQDVDVDAEVVIDQDQDQDAVEEQKDEPYIEEQAVETDTLPQQETSFGYNTLKEPLEALNIVFPNKNVDDDTSESLGKKGLIRIIENIDSLPYEFNSEYLNGTRSMFQIDVIAKYSVKMSNIGRMIVENEGISLVFSQYIYGGIVPIAIMLEEMGFVRYGTRKSFLSESYKRTNNIVPLMINGKQATYSMITSNSIFSGSNTTEINASTSEDNKDGSVIKVVLITKAGSEGIDLKNIRAVHILEPWYNMNRIEQIIGRAVRNCSHKQLELKHRSVMIYLYGTSYDEKECADLYVYRLAERKAITIGKVSRVLKNNAIDCILQSPGRSYLDIPKTFPLLLANGETIEYSLDNQSYTSNCDYMKTCAYKCSAVKNDEVVEYDSNVLEKIEPNNDTNSEKFLEANLDNLKQRIRNLFAAKYMYTREDLFHHLISIKKYPKLQLLKAIDDMTSEDTIDFLYDKYGQRGNLIEINNVFLFQPSSVKNTNITMQERTKPIDFKVNTIHVEVKNQMVKESPNGSMGKSDENELQYGDMFSIMMGDLDIGIIEDNLLNTFNIEKQIVDKIFLMYFYDTLHYENKVRLFLQIMNNTDSKPLSLDSQMKEILEQRIFTKGSLKYTMFADNNGNNGYVFKDGKWDEGNLIYYKEFEPLIMEKWYVKSDEISEYLGLIFTKVNKNTKEKSFDFKIKDAKKLTNMSAVCKTFNSIFRKDLIKYLVSSTDVVESFYTTYNSNRMCLFIQMFMRYKHFKRDEEKIWFLNLEQSMFNKKNHKSLKF